MKILITCPAFDDPGGITNYFSVLKGRFLINPVFVEVGKRVHEMGLYQMMRRLVRDYIDFINMLRREQFDLVHINISLNPKGIIRDSIYIVLSKMFGRKVLVFFHGWDEGFAEELKGTKFWIFKRILFLSSAIVVLGNNFEKKLMKWGFRRPIYTETTLVDDRLINGLDIHEIIKERANKNTIKILFLARIIKEKGIYESIDAVALLQKTYSNIHLIIAGEGDERVPAVDYVNRKGMQNVHFVGYVTGDLKQRVFKDAYIYCFPSYQEGMPTSLLEALSFGLPVITRPVGGVVDFFENGINGFMVEGKEFAEIAQCIEKLVANQQLYKQIAVNNYHLGQEKFLASEGVKRLESIYRQL